MKKTAMLREALREEQVLILPGAYDGVSARVIEKAGFKVQGPYDYALFLDSIEHFENWKEILTEVCSNIVDNGFIFTNYFLNEDFENVEHISMDHEAVKAHLISLGFYPTNEMVWIKRDFGKIGKTDEEAAA